MPEEERMTVDERYKYLRGQRRRYEVAERAGKGELLDEMEAVTGLQRKSLIRLMRGVPERRKRTRERGRTYGEEERQAVLRIAETLDWVCAERLRPSLGWMARLLVEQGDLRLTATAVEKVERMSTATVRRIVGSLAKERWQLPRKAPSPNPVARQVAVEHIAWDVKEAGHVEIDLVHHSGPTSEGEYLHTLQVVDVATGWSEREVVAGRSYVVVVEALARILDRLPFPLVEVHSDNGSEFLNHHLLRFWKHGQPAVTLTRSRPYRKNDSRYVEQKNSSLVRAYLGYQRLDSPAQAMKLEEAYLLMRLYYNLYQPVMHMVHKSYVSEPGRRSTTKRVYDEAATPLDRLIALGALSDAAKSWWLRQRRTIKPRQLRERIYALLEQLRSLPGASSLGDVRKLMLSLPIADTADHSLYKEAAALR